MHEQAYFKRSFDELKHIVEFTHGFIETSEVDGSLTYLVDLCVEELFVNMVNYNTETDTDILIELRSRDGGIEVSLTDFGVDRFDPREITEVDIQAPLENRTPGGLGLYLVLKMADSIHYEYRNRNSKITFIADRKQPNDSD